MNDYENEEWRPVPPTFEEFTSFKNMGEQLATTGWIGYGSRAWYVSESVDRFELIGKQLIAECKAHNRSVMSKRFEKQIQRMLGGTRNVVCASGTADLVTHNAVIEIKFNANRAALFTAIGQALIYRQAIDPQKVAVALVATDDLEPLIPIAEEAPAVGVMVIIIYKGHFHIW